MPRTRSSPTLSIAVLLADVTCFGIVMPLLASYAAEYHASTAAIGVLVGVYSLLHFLLAPVWGRLSDRIGRRPVLLVGLVGTLGSSILFAAADSFAGLVLSRIVAGGLGATLSVTQAYAADLTVPERRTRVMGFVGAAFGVGFILGPTIGGITSAMSGSAPGIAASILAAINLVVALGGLPEPGRSVSIPSSPLPPVDRSRFVIPFLAAFASTLAFTVIYVVFPLHAERALGFDRSRVSYLFALVGIMTAVVQGGVVGRFSRQYGEGRLLLTGGFLMALGLTGLALTSGAAWPLYPALAALGIGFGMAGPAEAGYVSRIAAPAVQGRVLGWLQSANSVARILGPVAAGLAMGAGGRQERSAQRRGTVSGEREAGSGLQQPAPSSPLPAPRSPLPAPRFLLPAPRFPLPVPLTGLVTWAARRSGSTGWR
jgi:MFS family permease